MVPRRACSPRFRASRQRAEGVARALALLAAFCSTTRRATHLIAKPVARPQAEVAALPWVSRAADALQAFLRRCSLLAVQPADGNEAIDSSARVGSDRAKREIGRRLLALD